MKGKYLKIIWIFFFMIFGTFFLRVETKTDAAVQGKGRIVAVKKQNKTIKQKKVPYFRSRKNLKEFLLKKISARSKTIYAKVDKKVIKNIRKEMNQIFKEMANEPKFYELSAYFSIQTDAFDRGKYFAVTYLVEYEKSKKEYQKLSKKNYKIYRSRKGLRQEIIKRLSNLQKDFSLYVDKKMIETMGNEGIADFLSEIQDVPEVNDTIYGGIQYAYRLYHTYGVVRFKVNHIISKKDQKTLKAFVKDWVATNITKEMSEEEKVRTINDYMVEKYQYSFGDQAHVNETNFTGLEKIGKYSVYSSYSLLYENAGVCDAKAKMFYWLGRKAGLDVKYIIGTGKGNPHAWNLVKVDGQWYHIDNTWNRGWYFGQPPSVFYNTRDYYLKGDDTFRKHHFWDASKYPAAPSDYPGDIPAPKNFDDIGGVDAQKRKVA